MALPSSNNGVTLGALRNQSSWGQYNQIFFAIQQAISKLQTSTLVLIERCTNAGELSPVGFVDVTPLVNQVDGSGNPTPHTTIYGLPYLRLQGGHNAVIIDPEPGDIGIAIFASRDISLIKSTKAQGNPGSLRSYSFEDGLYLGGLLNGTPQRFIRFGSDGLTLTSPDTITLKAPTVAIEGDATISGSLTVTGDVVGEGTSLHHHRHTSTNVGTPTSEPLP